MENRAYALATGLFVILLGLAVGLTVWWFSDTAAATRDLLLVTQRNVNGLNPLAQVRYRGMTAGKVIAINLDPEDSRNILVLVRVDAQLPLTRSTRGQLNSLGITGLSYVQLEDSGLNRELLPVDNRNPPRIPLNPTLMDALGDQANDIVGQISRLSINLNKVLNEDNLRYFNRTVENLAVASEGLRQTPELMQSLQALVSGENLQRVQGILAQLEKVAGEAAPMTAEVRQMVGTMDALGKQLDLTTRQLGGEIKASSLPRLNVLMADLQDNSRQLKRLLQGLESNPQALLLGNPPLRPGPGEAGFAAPDR